MKRDACENCGELRNRIYDALDRRDYAEARRFIIRLRPSAETEALGLLVSSYIEEGNPEEAIQALRELQAAAPGDSYTVFLSARIAVMQGDYLRAEGLLRSLKAVAGSPYAEQVWNLLGQCCRFLGKCRESAECYKKAAHAAPTKELAALEYGDYLFNRHYLPVTSLGYAREAAAGYDAFFRETPRFLHRKRRHEKIRIGYISPDIRNHVVLRFSMAMFRAYDRTAFEVTIYQNGPEDAYTRRAAGYADAFRNVEGLSAAQTARVIYEDGIDILVDLAGHTRGNALSALACKPAPVQVSGIGYFASTGLSAVDYFLGDAYLDDDESAQEFTERLTILPHSHFCYTPLEDVPCLSKPPCLRNGYVTFGSFNNFAKVNDDVLRVWKLIMEELPTARLLLKAAVFSREDTRAFAEEHIRSAGLDMSRVELRGETREYLSEYGDVDIALDTFPYPGGGTSCDALYMGVPLVTLTGRTHGSRFGKSLLMNLGLGELVSESEREYADKAVGLARDAELLCVLHENLRSMMQRSPLMDAARYLRDLEQAYRTMWEDYIHAREVPDYRAVRKLAQTMRSLTLEGDTTQAMAAADAVLEARPGNRALLEELCVLYLDHGDAEKAEEAAACLRLETEPYGYGYFLLASARFLNKRRSDARRLALRALSEGGLLPWQEGAVHHLLAELFKVGGDQRNAAEEYLASSVCKEIENGKLADYSNYLLSSSYAESSDETLLRAAEGYGALLRETPQYSHTSEKHRHDKLRVGYISPDFRRHIVACFSHAFFHAADRVCFEVYGYALCEENEVSRGFAAASDGFRYLKGMSAKAAAQCIFNDEIDILVDLSGHTGDNALPILAYKPAPVQCSGIGWFRTTGLPQVDYFIADEKTAQEGEGAQFVERLLRLPHTHLCYTPPAGAPQYIAPAPYRSNGYVTFASFNQFDKTTDEMLRLWSEILSAVPGSRLFLKSGAFDDEERRRGILARLEKLGIPAERLMYEGHTEAYFDAYARADIALDTYPYPGGGTTCDALYMGVPVITLAGRHHHARFGVSLLENIGLGELCAHTREEYLVAAVRLAKNPEQLSLLHQTIRRRMRRSPLMCGIKYMAELELQYAAIWTAWVKERAPELCIRHTKECERLLDEAEAQKNWGRAARMAVRLEAAGEAGDAERYLMAEAYYHLGDYERTLFWAARIRDTSLWRQDIRCMEIWALKALGRFRAAYAVCRTAISDISTASVSSDRREWVLSTAGWLAYTMGLPEAARQYRRALDETKDLSRRAELYSSYLLAQNVVEVEDETLFTEHLRYAEFFRDVKPYTHSVSRRERLRIGYISPDLRKHVMVHFAWPFLTAYDRSRYEVHVYSLTAQEDALSEELRGRTDAWSNLSGCTWESIAKKIHDDGIDILVDLAGHSVGSGLPVLAYKPAPLQISGLGYMASTGLSTVDYYWTDDVVDPAGMHEALFTERLLRLSSQFCYAPLREFPASEGAPCRQRGWVLFGVFNHHRKVSDAMLGIWRKILEAVPASKILLKSQSFFSPENVDDAFERLKGAGFDMDRVLFEPATLDYMHRYLDVDIALDTYPYPGGGTTADALYMGVPVITMYSERRSTRFAYGMLAAAGLEGLAVRSAEDYVARAVGLASDAELLDALHKNLRGMLERSPLMDIRNYMSEVEAWYETIWKERLEHET